MTQSPGPYSKSTMRKLVAAAVVLDVIGLGIATKYALDGDPAAPMLFAITGVCILVVALMVPLGIRRGRL